MIKYAYCLKKGEKIDDRKAVDYCITAGDFKAVCKHFSLRENSSKGINIIQLKLLPKK